MRRRSSTIWIPDRSALINYSEKIRVLSSEVVEIDLSSTPAAVQAPEVYAIHSKYFAATPKKYGRWMQERLKQAATVDTVSYMIALDELDQLRRSIEEVFSEVDFVLTRRRQCRRSP